MTHKSTILATLLVLAFPLSASAQFGIAAGLNFDSIDDVEADAQDVRGTFDQASGYHAGIFYDFDAGVVGARLGLFYRDLGDIGKQFEVAGVPTDVSVKVSMIEVPLDLKIAFVSVPKTTPYVLFGPVLSLPRSSSADALIERTFDDALKSLMVSGVVGGGVTLDLGTIALTPELRYVIGLSGLTGEEFTLGDTTFQVDETQKVRSVQLRVGLRF